MQDPGTPRRRHARPASRPDEGDPTGRRGDLDAVAPSAAGRDGTHRRVAGPEAAADAAAGPAEDPGVHGDRPQADAVADPATAPLSADVVRQRLAELATNAPHRPDHLLPPRRAEHAAGSAVAGLGMGSTPLFLGWPLASPADPTPIYDDLIKTMPDPRHPAPSDDVPDDTEDTRTDDDEQDPEVAAHDEHGRGRTVLADEEDGRAGAAVLDSGAQDPAAGRESGV